MRPFTKQFLLYALLLSTLATHAQSWKESISTPNPTFRELQDSFNAYWANRPQEKGKGYKQFKRWEWFWGARQMPDGTLPPAAQNWNEWKKYNDTHQGQLSKTSSTAAGNWTFHGTTSSAGGYAGIGRLNCIAFHPTNANTFWVGSAAGGLWKTTDGGSTWASNTDNLPVLGISDIAIDPTDPNIMYIATGDADGSDTKSLGVLKTTNGGATWNTTGLSWTATQQKVIRRLLIDPTNPQVLIVAASDGMYRTSNGGATWTFVQSGNYCDAEFKPGDPSIVYAATMVYNNPAIYRSTNGGASFTFITSITGGYRVNMAVSANDPTLVDVLVCNTSSGLLGLWASTNSGATFAKYFTGTTTNNMLHSSYNGAGSGGQGFYDLAYAINPADANDIWIGGVNTWRTTDGGTNWFLKTMWNGSPTSNPNNAAVVHADKHWMAFHPLLPNTLFQCNDGGLYKTTNGGNNWTDLSNGLGISQIYRIGTSATVNNDVICGLQDNGTKEYYNNSWYDHTGGDGMECIIDYTNANIMYSTYVNGLIYKTTNGGSGWSTIVSNSGTGVNSSGNWVTPYLMHPTNNQILIVGKAQVYQSTNGGTNWTQLGTITGATSNVASMAYAPSDPQVIYVATNNELYQTTNGGTTWNLVSTSTDRISYIAVDPLNPQRVWLTKSSYVAGNKVYRSTDGGTTFTNISGTLPNIPVNCIVYQKSTSDGIYIGTDLGVFYRDASMTDWITFNSGLPNVVVDELEISYNNNKIWAGTYGRGLWSSDLYSPTGCAVAAPSSAGNQSVCNTALPVTLSVTPPAGATTDWYSAATGGTLLLAGSNSYTTSTAGNYYAEARSTTTTGCLSTSRTLVTLVVNTVPTTPTTSAAGSTTFCQGGSVTLTSSAAANNQWYKDGVIIPGATFQNYMVSQSGNYSVLVNNNGCTSALSTATTVTVTPGPAQPVITQPGSTTLQSSSATGNQWYFNGTLIPGATGQTYNPTQSGVYTVQVTSGGCLSNMSPSFSYIIAGIVTPSWDNRIIVAPNPVQDQLTVRYQGANAHFTVLLLDISGRQVLAKASFTSSISLSMRKYAAGSYLVRIINDRTKEQVQRIIVKSE